MCFFHRSIFLIIYAIIWMNLHIFELICMFKTLFDTVCFSPSEGPCCISHSCSFVDGSAGEMCLQEKECSEASFCGYPLCRKINFSCTFLKIDFNHIFLSQRGLWTQLHWALFNCFLSVMVFWAFLLQDHKMGNNMFSFLVENFHRVSTDPGNPGYPGKSWISWEIPGI